MEEIKKIVTDIFKGSLKYFVPTIAVALAICVPIAMAYYFGALACIISLVIIIPLLISTINYCLENNI